MWTSLMPATDGLRAAAESSCRFSGPPELRGDVHYEGRPVTAVRITLLLPQQQQQQHQVDNAGDIQVEADGTDVHVSLPACQPWHVRLPFLVDAKAASAKLRMPGAVSLPNGDAAAIDDRPAGAQQQECSAEGSTIEATSSAEAERAKAAVGRDNTVRLELRLPIVLYSKLIDEQASIFLPQQHALTDCSAHAGKPSYPVL